MEHENLNNQETANSGIGAVSTSMGWELKGHSYQIADTGDYDGYYEITNGKISLLTKDDDDEALQPIVDALNDSGCNFYQDDWFEFENKMLKEEISRLKFMIDNSLGWKDIENDISPMHEL
jgi:hypothetical protein